jgi:hypothetical protein
MKTPTKKMTKTQAERQDSQLTMDALRNGRPFSSFALVVIRKAELAAYRQGRR